MTTTTDYSLLAANVYGNSSAVKSETNIIPTPDGWTTIRQTSTASTGFMASAYIKGGELVIAYAGTTSENILDWVTGNIPAATPLVIAPQIIEAAKFYLEVLASPEVASHPELVATFTGHSLGGGLASLMGVFFNKPATVFDEAPFQPSADAPWVASELRTALELAGLDIPTELADYVPLVDRIARESNVSQISVKGEILSDIAFLGLINGSEQFLDPNARATLGWGGVSAQIDLHSITLLSGFLQSPSFLAAAQGTPELLPRLFKGLFPNLPADSAANLLDLLVQRQYRGEATLDALAVDVSKISADGLVGVAAADGSRILGTALVDAAIAGLYAQTHSRDPLVGGYSQVSTTLRAQPGALSVDLALLGGESEKVRTQLDLALEGALGALGNEHVSLAPADRYTFQNGAGGMNVSMQEDGKSDVVVGYDGNDTVDGGGGADLLIGGAGSDILSGGEGADRLYGDAGNDWLGYFSSGETFFSAAELESEGNSYYGGVGDDHLGGSRGSDNYYFSSGDGRDTLYTNGGADTLYVTGSVEAAAFMRDGLDLIALVADHPDGSDDFVRVRDWFTAGTSEHQLSRAYFGGQYFTGLDISTAALHVEGGDEHDVFDGVSGYSDVINGNGGDDSIDVSASGDFKASDEVHGGDGNDEITAGNSDDQLYGDAGDDYVDGGTGNDYIEGGIGDDALYSRGNTASLHGGEGGDFVFSQGTGATLTGDDGDDYVYAKGSQNTLFGGAGVDFMRTRGTNLFADGGADGDWLLDQGANNQLYGGMGDDDFSLEGSSSEAHGGSGSDHFYNFGTGNTLDGGADNDSYYSENADITVVMTASTGDDTLEMTMPTPGVLRISGLESSSITSYLDGTSLVISTGTSSLTLLNYVTNGSVNPNFGGIQFDDGTVPTSDLPHPPSPDTSTIRGTPYAETLVGNGVAYRIIGMGGNDTLFGSGASETFEWSEGDGLDTVWAQSSDVVSFEGSGYAVTAHRSGNDLTLNAGTGGGIYIPGWFTGQNRPSVRAPDGTVWSPSAIDSQFSDGVYDITYSTGVYRIEDALPMLLSYCPDLDGIGLAGFNRANYNATPSILSNALPDSMWGEEHVDSAGQHYTSWSAPIVDDTFTDGLLFTFPYWGGITVSETSGTYSGGSYASARGSLEWDYWTDASGQGYVALTHASSSVQTGYQWVVPPTEESPYWSVGRYGSGSYTGPSESSVRQVEELAPRVDDFVLYGAGSAGAMALMSAYEYNGSVEVGLRTSVSTGDVAVDDLLLMPDSALVAAHSPTSGMRSWESLSAWQVALQRIGEDVTVPARQSLGTATTEASRDAAPDERVSTGYLAQPEFGPVLGADPLAYFFRDSDGVALVGTTDSTRCYIQPYTGTLNDFRLAA